MSSFIIEGGHPLSGIITPQGAKNEALQILCAVLLTSERVVIENVPDIVDVNKLIDILGKLGVKIEKLTKEGKTYFVVRDYDKLRAIFGNLLKEVQRIKSEGDYEAGKNLIEKYGVKVDKELHAEILKRNEKFNTAPYSGFINPELVPVLNDSNEIIDIKLRNRKNNTNSSCSRSRREVRIFTRRP